MDHERLVGGIFRVDTTMSALVKFLCRLIDFGLRGVMVMWQELIAETGAWATDAHKKIGKEKGYDLISFMGP